MEERYRVRSGYIVQLTTDQTRDLVERGSCLADIDGTRVEFNIDGTERNFIFEADECLALGFDGVERLTSGFPAHYYNLDEFGGEDLIVMAEDRLDFEERTIAEADGYTQIDPEEFVVREEPEERDVETEENSGGVVFSELYN